MMKDLNAIEAYIQEEYRNLCNILSLTQVSLDVYIAKEGSTEITEFGTCIGNYTPAYSPQKLIMPLVDYFNMDQATTPTFPPEVWDRNHPYEWPIWRIELWHEVCHQVEDQIFNEWDAKIEQGEAWEKSMKYIADCFSITINELSNALS
jgi:hypothetical protein